MQIASSEEMTRFERNLPWLAITAAVTPFVGLFGTVWGIIDAFHGLGPVVQPLCVLLRQESLKPSLPPPPALPRHPCSYRVQPDRWFAAGFCCALR